MRRGGRPLGLLCVEIREESGVLGQVGLELGDADSSPVLEPALLEIALDAVKTSVHALMIGSPEWLCMGRSA